MDHLTRTPFWQLIAETVVLTGIVVAAWQKWPQSWDDMSDLMLLFSFPCCILPSLVHLLAIPLLLAIPVFAWYRCLKQRVVPIGLVVFTLSLVAGFFPFLVHTGDSTEFPMLPYLWYGWGMLAGAAASTIELRWRGCKWKSTSIPLWAAVPVFIGKPFTDIAFAGC
jgi:hypothetical protein